MSRYDDIKQAIGSKTIFCSNLGFGETGVVLSHLNKAIYITNSTDNARQMKEQLEALGKDCYVIDDFDKPFTLSTFQSGEHKVDLLNAIAKIATTNSVLISTEHLFFSLLPNFENFKNSILNLEVKKDYDIAEIEKRLVELGYKKVETVTAPGEFALRGDILDVFNSTDNMPTRFDFFDTNLEYIYKFDFLTFEKNVQQQKAEILPNKLLLLSEEEKQKIVAEISKIKIEQTFTDLTLSLERGDDIPLEFIAPFCNSIQNIFELDLPIVISNSMVVES